MTHEIILDGDHALLAKEGVLVTFEDPKAKPTRPVEKKRVAKNLKMALWGDDNLFPQRVFDECKKSTIIPSTLDKMARFIYSGGITYGILEYGPNGEEKFLPRWNEYPEIRAWMRQTNIQHYIMAAAKDFVWFYNNFPEVYLNADRTKIVRLNLLRATDCRYSRQNEKNGLIEKVYVNKNWRDDRTTLTEAVEKSAIDCLDPLYDQVGQIKSAEYKNSYKFVTPVSYPSIDQTYYQLADWDAARTSKWLEFSLEIPRFKAALMKNQMTIKYHIEIADLYWRQMFKDWDTMGNSERETERKKKLDEFVSLMKGSDNAGNVLLSTSFISLDKTKEFSGWKITPIDNKVKDGIYIEDSSEASSHILNALGVDPTLVGNGPGKQFGSGSGSDKRVAYNLHMSLIRPHQDLLLQPLNLVRDYNGWDPNLVFRFKNSFINTLDKGAQTETKPA